MWYKFGSSKLPKGSTDKIINIKIERDFLVSYSNLK